MLFLLTAFVGLWVNNLVNNKSIVQQLNDEQSSARSILTLHYMLNEQQELLDRISSASSLEEKQRYFEKFQQLIQFMDTVVFPGKAMHPQFDAAQARQRVRDFIAGQLKIIEQVTVPADDAKAQLAFAQFVRQSAPMIQNLNAFVDEAVNYEALVSTKNDIADILEKSEQNYRSSYYLIAFLGTFGLAFGIFTIYVVRSTGATEDALLEQGERIRALHEIISR
ncbi:MAG: hypothetical protein PVH98_02575, partial [Gammaproteobacteria bacterium]